MEYLGFFERAFSDFLRQTPSQQIAIFITVSGPTFGLIYWAVNSTLKFSRSDKVVQGIRAELAIEKDRTERLTTALEDERQLVRKWMPASWLHASERKPEIGNGRGSIEPLLIGIENYNEEIIPIVAQLLDHYLVRDPDDESTKQAEKFARILTGLDPQNKKWRKVLSEVLNTEWKKDPHAPDSDHALFPDSAKNSLVAKLVKRAVKLHFENKFYWSDALFRNAAEIAKSRLPPDHPVLLFIEFELIRTSSMIGDEHSALKKVQDLLPRRIAASGARSREVEFTRFFEAELIYRTGKFDAAADNAQALLNDFEDDSNLMLGAKHLLCQCLLRLDRAIEAKATIDDVVRVRTETLGEVHRNTIASKVLNAQITAALGAPEQALKDVRSLVRKHLNEQHYGYPDARMVEMELLIHLGRVEEASEVYFNLIELAGELYGEHSSRLQKLQAMIGE